MAVKAEPKGRLLVDVFKDEMKREGEQVSDSTSGDKSTLNARLPPRPGTRSGSGYSGPELRLRKL